LWPAPKTVEGWYQPASATDERQQSVHGLEDASNVPDEHLYTVPSQESRIISLELDDMAALRQLLLDLSLGEDLSVSDWTEAFSTEAVESEAITPSKDGEVVINLVCSPHPVYELELAPIIAQILQLQRAYNICTQEVPEQILHQAAGGIGSTRAMMALSSQQNWVCLLMAVLGMFHPDR
jgi:hypothetical protein